MSVTCNYGCETLPDHAAVICGETLLGGWSSVGLLECSHAIEDFSDETEAQAAIDNGTLRIIKPIRGRFPEPSAIEGPNPSGCGPSSITKNLEYTFTFEDYNVSATNDTFYNAAMQRTFYVIVYNCTNQQLRVAQFPARIMVKFNGVEEDDQDQFYGVELKWKQFSIPTLVSNAPTTIYS